MSSIASSKKNYIYNCNRLNSEANYWTQESDYIK